MKEILYDEIPSLDLADFNAGDPVRKAQFVAKLGEAYNNIGFVAVRNHYLSQGMQDRLYPAIKKFFGIGDLD
mgnify:FL=1